jgi:predicted ATPase/class 3 adenylate cyclase
MGIFLFTDIEGSTRRWEADADVMRMLLQRHDDLLVECVRRAGGEVFKHTGDGLHASFVTAASALSAAIAAQLALAAGHWGVPPLTVRMAVHAGDADRRGGDWFGPALNRCSRLMGIAHGGQILLSAAARALVVETLPPDVDLMSLGEHQLRDLALPEHVFQVVAPALRRTFPPPRSLTPPRGNLPSPLTAFYGRGEEISRVLVAMADARLVTLTGPGGVGKTRLSLQIAASCSERYAHGGWFVDLAPVSRNSGDGVDHAVVATLGLQYRGDRTPRELLTQFLYEWQALIILDNCEHVPEQARGLAQDLLRRCPDLTVMTTTREPLRASGEHVITVGPLTDAAAAELLIDRASATKRTNVSTADISSEAPSICTRLDRMPLAIELAAARLRTMSPTELSAHLDERFRLLVVPPTMNEARHFSLQAVVDWSYDLLEDNERQLFDRLSVFAGGCDLAACHSVCAPDGTHELSTLDVLTALVDKSLVQIADHNGRTRYWLLETLREYGGNRLAAEQAAVLKHRHAHHFAKLASGAWQGTSGAEEERWIEWFTDEFDNLRVAVEWAFDLPDLALARRMVVSLGAFGHLYPIEVWSWMQRVEDLGVDDLDERIGLEFGLILRSHFMGDPTETERRARQVIDLITAAGRPPNAGAHLLLAFGLFYQNRFAETAQHIALGLDIIEHQDHTDHKICANLLYLRACLDMSLGLSAQDHARAALAQARLAGGSNVLGFCLLSNGAATATSDPESARAFFSEALPLAIRTRDRGLQYRLLGYTALMNHVEAPAAALQGLSDMLTQHRNIGSDFAVVHNLREWLPVFAQSGSYEMVAIIDGATPSTSMWRSKADAAVSTARAALGVAAYDECTRRGAVLSRDELHHLVIADVARLAPNSEPTPSDAKPRANSELFARHR